MHDSSISDIFRAFRVFREPGFSQYVRSINKQSHNANGKHHNFTLPNSQPCVFPMH